MPRAKRGIEWNSLKRYPHTTHPLSDKKLIHSQPVFFERTGKMFQENHTFETEVSVESHFGFFEWNIKEDKITICSYLSGVLAFENNNPI